MRAVDVDCNREDSPAGGAHTRSINRKERKEHKGGFTRIARIHTNPDCRSADIPVRSNVRTPGAFKDWSLLVFVCCSGQECPRSARQGQEPQSKTWSQKDENSFVSLTPCFSWVKKWPEQQQPFQRFPHAAETVETVPTSSCSASTQLKQGVNETLINQFTHTSTN